MENNLISKKTAKSIFKVAVSNIVKLLTGVLVAFLLPKMMEVEGYGYYKTFTLYAGYIGLFQLGFADGIYLKFAGNDFKELDKCKFRLFLKVYFIYQLLISLLVGCFLGPLVPSDLCFIFICLAVYITVSNLFCFYQMISQITSRFSELSIVNTIQGVILALSVIVLWFIHKYNNSMISYMVYTIVFILIYSIQVLIYMYIYRDITFGKSASFKDNKKELLNLVKIGFPLMIANLCFSFVLTIDRQFVNILFDNTTYAIYAFAYNMLNLITTTLSAISVVIYPILKRSSGESIKYTYSILIFIIMIIVFAGQSVYFPLEWFINWFLPKYSESLPIFRIILPGIAMSCSISIVMHNYYKTENKEVSFFVRSLIILIISTLANLIAYNIFKTTISISIASVIVMLLWYIIIEIYFIRKYKVKWVKNMLYMISCISIFYIITGFMNWWLGLIVYLLNFIVLTLFLYGKELLKLKKFLKKEELSK